MVECESVLVEQKDIVEQVLIDTWWNVNANINLGNVNTDMF